MTINKIKTKALHLAYEHGGPSAGKPLLLVHGWPDSPRTWDKILPCLHQAGFRTIVPYLRGYGPSSFRDPIIGRNRRRTGQPVAFAQDIIDLADHLNIERFDYVGHDWGARTGYALAALFPRRLKSLTAISVPFEPGKAEPPAFPQAQAFWYQWLLCTKPGEKKFRQDPVAFGRAQWDAWSPHGWYTSEELAEAAKSWHGKDFVDVVLHSYRSRWGHADLDPNYAALQGRFEATKTIDIPTMLIHGKDDRCELLTTTEGAKLYFSAGYRRVLLERVGHFPQREYPEGTARAILDFLGHPDDRSMESGGR
jgi:pimeloyl-ACP methyl ester carboxylesterase